MNNAIKLSFKTWYPEDHPLHLDPLHPAIGLAGKAGELLNLYKKKQFKDEVSWWDCVHCGHSKTSHSYNEDYCYDFSGNNYTPKIIGELGDLWYYLRILAYQRGVDINDCIKYYSENKASQAEATVLIALTNIMYWSSRILHDIVFPDGALEHSREYSLVRIFFWLRFLLEKLDCTLDKLTSLNYDKLKDGDNHGWSSTLTASWSNNSQY